MYTDMSQSVPGEEHEVFLKSTPITSEDAYGWCIRFWYHMYGDSINYLRSYYVQRGVKTLSWYQSGSKGPQWRFGQVSIFIL